MNKLTYIEACKESLLAPWVTIKDSRREVRDFGEALLGLTIKMIALTIHIVLAVLFPLTAILLIVVQKLVIRKRRQKLEQYKKRYAENDPWGHRK